MLRFQRTYHKFKHNKWECGVAHHDARCDAGENVVEHARKLCALESVAEHAARCTARRYHQCARGKGQIVARVEAVPHSAQGECQQSAILLGHALVDECAQPAICAAVPVVDRVPHIGGELQRERESGMSNCISFRTS